MYEKVLKANPYRDNKGRFATQTVGERASTARELAINRSTHRFAARYAKDTRLDAAGRATYQDLADATKARLDAAKEKAKELQKAKRKKSDLEIAMGL